MRSPHKTTRLIPHGCGCEFHILMDEEDQPCVPAELGRPQGARGAAKGAAARLAGRFGGSVGGTRRGLGSDRYFAHREPNPLCHGLRSRSPRQVLESPRELALRRAVAKLDLFQPIFDRPLLSSTLHRGGSTSFGLWLGVAPQSYTGMATSSQGTFFLLSPSNYPRRAVSGGCNPVESRHSVPP